MVVVDDSCLQANSQPKSLGLFWGSTAAWRCSTFIKWTEWTLAMTLWSCWEHYKHCHGYYYYYYYLFGWLHLLTRSINEVICHGIPDQRTLEDGDIINSMADTMWLLKPISVFVLQLVAADKFLSHLHLMITPQCFPTKHICCCWYAPQILHRI